MGRFGRAGLVTAAVVGSLIVVVSALGSSSKALVTVTAGKPSELKFTVSPTAAAKGSVSFRVTNKGKLEHDFRIAGKTSAKLKPGKSTTLTVNITKPGKYAFLCTVKGHAAGGMKGTFTIKK